ncbi:E3 ubiquitin-protein ligase RFWD3-like [Thrips palmi]|uniref:RING-type E3 ubiquitin transferase n=1 Tax=Thrips palmi TaxID=161013 RepID=A0A6P9ABZ4_THRPL|nr:E3 ubiquitin-protein ligase RFWD3-like [Thrips palmi]XP_034255678.1 E3 ubiquitin-protein ligase RFWD3-like [Thrips palmi]
MDEVVHTPSDGGPPPDDESRLNESTSTSPILTRHSVRLRTPRTIGSSSGWIHAGNRQSSITSAEDTGSSNLQVSAPESFNQLEEQSEHSNLPPIEDRELIIHRPDNISVIVQAGESVGEDLGVSSSSDVTDDRNIDAVNEAISVDSVDSGVNSVHFPPGASSDSATSESVIALDENPETVDVTYENNPTQPVSSNETSAAPDVENLPLAQRIRSPDLLPTERSPLERSPQERSPSVRSPLIRSPAERSPPEKSPPSKKLKTEPVVQIADENLEEDEGNLCSICLDAWTNSGDHRLVALRCGHLFGQHCILHWLQIHKANDRRCPQCKKKSTVKDIRPLYASKIRVLDTSEQEALKETIKKLEQEKESLTRELAYEKQLHQEAIKIQNEQQLKLQQLQNHGILGHSVHLPATSKQVAAIAAQIKINLLSRIEVSRHGDCRVLAFNEWKGVLVASNRSSVTPLFPNYGIKLYDTEEFRLCQTIPLHNSHIRDLSFNPHRKDLLLSVSLDKTAKVFCTSTNAPLMSLNAEVPLWSCCWDGNNSNLFFAGSGNGVTLQYDLRNLHSEVSRITTQGDAGPVVSLNAIPGGSWLPNGGFLSCRLNRIRVYERTSNSEFREYPLSIDGPFFALNYNHKSQHMLVSTRPTSQSPHVQYQLYEVGFAASQPRTNLVHTFLGGTIQRAMSRPCQLEVDGNVKDTLICAHQEAESHVAIWSMKSGQKIPAGPLHCSDHVKDLCPININNRSLLASLTDKALRVYQFSS